LLCLMYLIGLTSQYYSFDEARSIEKLHDIDKDSIEIIIRKDTHFGCVVLYKNHYNGNLGVTSIEYNFGLIKNSNGSTEINVYDQEVPFHLLSNHNHNDKEIDQHVIGLYTNDKDIFYLVFGPKSDKLEEKLKEVNMNLETFRNENPEHLIEPVVNGYALLLDDAYSVNRWNSYAFDKNGKLIASKIAGTGDAVYVKNSEETNE